MMARQPIGFRAHQIGKTFAGSVGEIPALSGVTFSVEAGEFVCIIGPSGCGKSTLLKILAGLVQPTSGEIEYDRAEKKNRLRTLMVFQEHGLYPWLTLLENVAFGLEMLGVPRDERNHRAKEFLEQTGLGEFSRNFPHELSGGMRQRAAIARAVLSEPDLLLMDEPFSAIDAQSKLVLQEELLRIFRLYKQTVVYVTHDIDEAVLLGDRVLLMSGRPGRIKAEFSVPLGRPRNLLDKDQPDLKEMKWSIWKAIEGQVRQNLHFAA